MIILFFLLMPIISFADMLSSYSEGHSLAAGQQFNAKADLVPGYAGDNPAESNLDAVSLGDTAARKMAEDNSPGKMVGESQEFLKSKNKTSGYNLHENDPLLTISNGVIENPQKATDVEEIGEQTEEVDSIEKSCEKPVDFEFTCDWIYTPIFKIEQEAKIIPMKYHVVHDYPPGTRFSIFRTVQTLISSIRVGTLLSQSEQQKLYHAWKATEPNKVTESFEDIISIVRPTGQSGGEYVLYYDSWGPGHSEGKVSHTYNHLDLNCLIKVKKAYPGWSSICGEADNILASGSYDLVREDVIEGPETRVMEGIEVQADAWRIRRTYKSKGEGCDTCTPLLKKGCYQTKGECSKYINGRCVCQKLVLKCPTKKRLTHTKLKGHDTFCLDGNCHKAEWEDNTDMMTALSHLSLLKEMQAEASAGQVFKGNGMSCSKHCWGFSDCCQLGGGWGESVGFTNCNEGEKLLAKQRREKKCVYVGTFCTEKALGVCIRKKNSYCCFGSKLTRLIQEQGRQQLGLGFGDAQCPDCRGLTIDEISRLDFDRLNLAEAFEDIKVKAVDVAGTTKRFSEDWKKRLPKLPKIKAPEGEAPMTTATAGEVEL